VDVSVIIPALNEAETIRQAIDSAWQAGAAEVIVADGGSSDGTFEIVEACNCQLVRSAPGRAVQQNAGADQARGDVLLFLHADNRLADSAVSQIEAALKRKQVLGGAFRQRIDASGFLYRCLEWGNAARVRCFGLPYGDQAIFLRREIFYELGRFPEVRLMEDVKLMQKLRRRARPVLLPGPMYVSPRRWQRHGVIRQTLRNWSLLAAFICGVSPDRLAAFYRRHDATN
jgi:rSAM/selenodomain-associated transferase 2